jgi:histidine triad (HIT) family protein
MSDSCAFCRITDGTDEASVVLDEEHVLAVMDLRQFHPGHVLLMPRRRIPDVRTLPSELAGPLMRAASRVTTAVSDAFPNEGISLWHSIGSAAFQEVPHLHIHVHPRRAGDGLLAVYPDHPPSTDRASLDEMAARIRSALP